jgi:RimJ/RimL family protein N-acetyltransferase
MEMKSLPKSRWKEYKKLRLEMLRNCPIMFGSSHKDEMKMKQKDWEGRLSSKFSESIFAVDEKDKPVGMITAVYSQKQTQKHVSMIVSFYVSDSHRGQGIGKKLFAEILKRIKKRKGIRKIKIQAATVNQVAIGLYKGFGFEQVGLLKNEVMVDGKYYDDVVMEKMV